MYFANSIYKDYEAASMTNQQLGDWANKAKKTNLVHVIICVKTFQAATRSPSRMIKV